MMKGLDSMHEVLGSNFIASNVTKKKLEFFLTKT
jgi:hypothetical protein